MNKKIVTIAFISTIIAALAIVVSYILKPSFDSQKNPYALDIDSISNIPEGKYCNVISSDIPLPLEDVKAIAIDKDKNIFVSGDDKIVVLSVDGVKEKEFKTGTTATALAIDNNNVLYLALENKISVFDRDGRPLHQWQVDGKAVYISSLAVFNEVVYAADAFQALVFEYSIKGSLIKTYGNK